MKKCTKQELLMIQGGKVAYFGLVIIGLIYIIAGKYSDYKRGKLKYFKFKF